MGDRILMTTRLFVHLGSLLVLTTDPYVLFPDRALKVETECVIHPGAHALLAEGFAVYDPSGAGRPFATLETASRIRRSDGRMLAEDRSTFTGEDFDGSGGSLGGWRALGSVLILGGAVDAATLERRLDAVGVLGGASPLPNDDGLGVRLLASDGGSLARGLELAFAAGFEALAGCVPARRRK
jgi:urease accessory protein